jgi:hypothetical protein
MRKLPKIRPLLTSVVEDQLSPIWRPVKISRISRLFRHLPKVRRVDVHAIYGTMTGHVHQEGNNLPIQSLTLIKLWR